MLFGTEFFEIRILKTVHSALICPFLDFFMPAASTLGNGGIIWIALALALLISKRWRKVGFVVSFSLILCLIAGNIILKPLIARTRPFDFDNSIILLIDAPKDFSFPSGHTFSSFAAAFSILLTAKEYGISNKWTICALLLATFIAFSRIYLCVHYPTDVFCGIILGFLAALSSKHLINVIQKKN